MAVNIQSIFQVKESVPSVISTGFQKLTLHINTEHFCMHFPGMQLLCKSREGNTLLRILCTIFKNYVPDKGTVLGIELCKTIQLH